ncbi:type II toxin-antitoxin system RelE/ParE family toxin [Neorhizobium alkalisoli]|uniref:type II toxin-antitoxin system RelE/ParE family toxin n=1 Tax=Neorhizobium alkalisoli TaxID=528178 RepID=UPI000CF850AD|nr:type II toxin-antitoxin system RelE/ParE family toxin [Neorhizobium alkalisoli]
MIVNFTPEARGDLDRIWAYIEQSNPRRAISFVREIVGRSVALSDMPLRYPLVPGHEVSGIRRVPRGNYLIFYRIVDERVDILHILNGAQDYKAILFPDE